MIDTSDRRALEAVDILIRRQTRGTTFELNLDRLELRLGEALAVLGPNGAGKSTLLRALAGLERPVRGRIHRLVPGPVTMVFQRPIALAGSVEHNIRVALRGVGLPSDEAHERTQEALRRFGITPISTQRAATLSGGELRRLALARAFALRPAVLLLDEPFDGLDASARESLSTDLRAAIADTGVAVAVVTHDLRRALSLCDRIAVLIAGRVRQLDTHGRIIARPLTPDIARLVGMCNLIPGEVATDTGGVPAQVVQVVIDPLHRIPAFTDLPGGTPVWVGLRPEHLKIDMGRGQGTPIGSGKVQQIVSDGLLTTLTIRWAGFSLRTHLITGRGLARVITEGAEVTLAILPQDVHLIRRETAPS